MSEKVNLTFLVARSISALLEENPDFCVCTRFTFEAILIQSLIKKITRTIKKLRTEYLF